MGNMIVQALMGLLIGYCARFFLPGHDRWGIIITSIIGMVGAWAGPQIAGKIGLPPAKGVLGFVYAVASAMLLLLILRHI